MSWLDDLSDIGSSIFKSSAAQNIALNVAKTAALGLILNQVSKSVNKDNSKPETAKTAQPDRYVREQLSPDTNHSIPIVYGTAFTKGIITDAVLSGDNKTMWYCITICEKTGTLLSTGAASSFTFNSVFLNSGLVTFQGDGITVQSITSADGVVDSQMNGLIKIYCFNNGSSAPVVPQGYTNGNLGYAYGIMPNWTVNHTMDSLVFALVRVEYSKERNVTSLGDIEFKLTNSMTLPGDCLNDYMRNTRYGAGIPDGEIYSV
jgi:hypothetical protein